MRKGFLVFCVIAGLLNIYCFYCIREQNVYRGFKSDGNWAGEGIKILTVEKNSPAEKAGLKAGDIIIEFDGKKIKDPREGLKWIRETQAGKRIPLKVLRKGNIFSTYITFIKAPFGTLIYHIILAVIFFILGVFTYFKGKNKSATLLSTFYLVFSIFISSYCVHFEKTFPYLLLIFSATLLPIFFLHFTFYLPKKSPIIQKYRIIEYLIYIPLIFGILWEVEHIKYTQFPCVMYYRRVMFYNHVIQVLIAFYFLLGLFNIFWTFHNGDALTRRQLKWVLWGLAVGFAPALILFIIPNLIRGFEIVPLHFTLIPSIIFLVSLTFSIIKYKLIDVDYVIRRSAVYGFTFAIFSVIYLIILFLANLFIKKLSGIFYEASFAVTFFSFGFFFLPLYRKIKNAVDKIFFKKLLSYEKVLAEYGRMIKDIVDMQKLLTISVEMIRKALPCEWAEIIFYDHEFNRTFTVKSKNESIFIRHEKGDTYYDLIKERNVSFPPGENLTELSLLITSEGRVAGLLSVGEKTIKDVYTREDIEFLNSFINYLSLSAKNILTFEKLKYRIKVEEHFHRFLPRPVVEEIVNNPERIKLGGDIRKLTILFADIKGFTELSEKLPPQEVVNLLNDYLSLITDVIFMNNGTLDKYIGDGVLAFFGAPISRPDDTLRAIKAAIYITKEIKKLSDEREKEGKPHFEIGIGINTGEVLVGNIGSEVRMDYTVIGDAVNTAQRVQTLTKPYQILITEYTYNEVKDKIITKSLGKFDFKGKSKSIEIFEVIGIKY